MQIKYFVFNETVTLHSEGCTVTINKEHKQFPSIIEAIKTENETALIDIVSTLNDNQAIDEIQYILKLQGNKS